MELNMNIGQLIVFLNWDLVEKITRPLVKVYIEAGCYPWRDLNEMKESCQVE